jgi:4-alpha-glucanotransferase
VVAVIVGIVVLDEPFEWRLVAGGGLTALGVAAVNRKPAVAAGPEPAAGQPPSSDAASPASPSSGPQGGIRDSTGQVRSCSMASDAWGLDDGYDDIYGRWHATSPETAASLHEAMGARPGVDAPPVSRHVWVVRQGAAEPLHSPCLLTLEDGTELTAAGSLPPDLPIGYHDLQPGDGGPPTRLIVTPGRCFLPADLRDWVLAVQLPACRSRSSWGMGDAGDLARIGAWARDHGAGMVAINPLHAPLPLPHVEPSPYYPSSRRWKNPLYIRVEDVPGAAGDAEVARMATEARRLNRQPLVDRDATWALKQRALERIWSLTGGDPGFDRWRLLQGREIEDYAVFCALAEHHGSGWSSWPAEYRHPSRPQVAAFAAAKPDRVGFWAWLQYLLEGQLAAAGAESPLLTDLAIGVDPDGADAWTLQDLLAHGVSVGAPPDALARGGQDWGLPPFIPWKLREAGYEPLARLWRSALSPGRGGGLRIDHVMGLFRLFWIPPAAGASEGAYVRYRSDELLAVLAVESVRAGAVIVGEDLGTVEPAVRHALGEAGVLSYRLVWFEDGPPEHYPPQAMAAVTTHDLPTVAGVWDGSDDEDQRAAGVEPDRAATDDMRFRLRDVSGLGPHATVNDVIVAAHRRLGHGPTMLVAATMEDGLAVRPRPNLPGTTTERPNWSHTLPLPLEEALTHPLLLRLARTLRRS